MTVIIGSLFLPYTVQFEVGVQDDYSADNGATKLKSRQGSGSGSSGSTPMTIGPNSGGSTKSKRSSVSGSRPLAIKQSSILPSLSSANSHQTSRQHSPSTSPGARHMIANYKDRKNSIGAGETAESVEDFFLQELKENPKNASEIFAENLHDKLRPQFIQPRSTVNTKVESSVIQPKKQTDDFGLPSVKFSRSNTNLTSLNPSGSSSPALSSIFTGTGDKESGAGARVASSLNRSGLYMTLNNNSSTSLIEPIVEEDEVNDTFDSDSDTNDWDNDFNDMVNPRTKIKLAPFGGFSNPQLKLGIIDKSNVFETSPWKVLFAAKGNGSLIKAVKMAVDDHIIDNRKWVGTLAMPTDEVPQRVIDSISTMLKNDYFSEAVLPSDMTFSGHYKSFCKQVLWPTLHYEIPDNPKSKAFEDHSWGHYKTLNQLVADKIVEVYKRDNNHLDPDDPENMIWIHDYHLLLVPQMIREQLPDAKIGLFLHVSFPSSEVFRCLAQRDALLKGMLGANSISFQTEEYVRHFLQTCSRLLLADTSDYGMSYDGRFTMVNTIPVGIDANSLNDVLTTDNVVSWRRRIRERWGDQRLIVSRDKLDKLRGIKEKFLAYEAFLRDNPSYVDTTVLIQICIGAPSDEDYASEVMRIVSRINAMADNISVSQPVVLLQQDISFDQYLALQMEADVFVVSSMREGLNLTSHEFIIATTEKKSPLMLSEFTGSSNLLDADGQGALLINPWDIRHFSNMFLKSLNMDPKEKMSRWRKCHDVVTQHDYKSWVQGCLGSVNEAWNLSQQRNTMHLQAFNKEVLQKFFTSDGKKLFFINLETASAITNLGEFKTVTNNIPVSANTMNIKNSDLIPPTHIAKLLNDLLNDSNSRVYLCSYLKRSTLDTLFKRVPKLGLIAENGGYIKIIDSKKWVSIVNEEEASKWMPQVQQIVEAKVERLPGSKADVEDCTIIFNPGKSFNEDRTRSISLMGDLIQHVNDIFDEREGVHASLIRNNVVIQQNQLSLRALNFLVNFYNKESTKDFDPKDVYDSSPASTPVKEKRPILENFDGKLTGLFVSGGTTSVDEPIYNFGNNLLANGIIPQVLTVAALDNDCKSTSAKYGVFGRNELLSVISNTVTGLQD